MSWSCETCGRGREAKHDSCRVVRQVSRLHLKLCFISRKLDKVVDLLGEVAGYLRAEAESKR